MKRAHTIIALFCLTVIAGLLLASPGLAAEVGNDWRPTYDMAMKWVNFAILVFLFIKFLKKPLLDFLSLRKESVARDIEKLEEEKSQVELKSRETHELIEKGEAHIALIKQRIIEQGEQEKARIIEEAREQSRFVLADAKVRAQNQLVQAERSFKAELLESAIELAVSKLPQEMTKTDHDNLFDSYLKGASA